MYDLPINGISLLLSNFCAQSLSNIFKANKAVKHHISEKTNDLRYMDHVFIS